MWEMWSLFRMSAIHSGRDHVWSNFVLADLVNAVVSGIVSREAQQLPCFRKKWNFEQQQEYLSQQQLLLQQQWESTHRSARRSQYKGVIGEKTSCHSLLWNNPCLPTTRPTTTAWQQQQLHQTTNINCSNISCSEFLTQVCIFAGQLEKTQDTRFHSRSRRSSMSGRSGDQLVAPGFSVCRPSLYLNCNVVSVLTFCLPSLALQIPSSTGPVPLYPLLI